MSAFNAQRNPVHIFLNGDGLCIISKCISVDDYGDNIVGQADI